MLASACSGRRTSRAFSRLACASSAVNGLRTAGFGPRLTGVRPNKATLNSSTSGVPTVMVVNQSAVSRG